MANYMDMNGKSPVTRNLTNFEGGMGTLPRGDIKYFRCPDNYIYIYHTDTLVVIPTYPESIQDSMGTNFQATEILSRPAPIQTYVSSGPRTVQIQLNLHRDMMFQITRAFQYNGFDDKVRLNDTNDTASDLDYIDRLVCELQAIAVPKYEDTTKMINVGYEKRVDGYGTEYYVKISGHGGYADYGKDIVCAAVSGIVTAAVQQLLCYYGEDDIKQFDFKLSEGDGWIKAVIENLDPAAGRAHGVFDTLLTGIEMISEQYPHNVAISRL